MSDPKQARHLLQVAEEDLIALRGQGDATVFTDRAFGFTAQQVAEKALKAWICLLGSTYPHTHDLSLLVETLAQHEAEVEPYTGLVKYTEYAGILRPDIRAN